MILIIILITIIKQKNLIWTDIFGNIIYICHGYMRSGFQELM